MASQGYTTKEIAEKLHVCAATIRNYRNEQRETNNRPETEIESCPEVIRARKRLALAGLRRKLREIEYPEEYEERMRGLEERVSDTENLLYDVIAGNIDIQHQEQL